MRLQCICIDICIDNFLNFINIVIDICQCNNVLILRNSISIFINIDIDNFSILVLLLNILTQNIQILILLRYRNMFLLIFCCLYIDTILLHNDYILCSYLFNLFGLVFFNDLLSLMNLYRNDRLSYNLKHSLRYSLRYSLRHRLRHRIRILFIHSILGVINILFSQLTSLCVDFKIILILS